MFAAIGKYVGGKVLTAILAVATLGSCYWLYLHPEHLETGWLVIRRVLTWLGIVLVLPWATFFLTIWCVRKESNLVAAMLLVGYLACDVAAGLWLADWSVKGSLSWAVLIVGFLAAGVYNFLVCDYQANRLEDTF